MESIVNVLGTLTAGLCAALLLRAFKRVRKRLLLWSGLCFAGLTASNALLLVDMLVLKQSSFYSLRLLIAAASLLVLLYGLVVESD